MIKNILLVNVNVFIIFFYYAPDYNPQAYDVENDHKYREVEIVETLGDGYQFERGKSVEENAADIYKYERYLQLLLEKEFCEPFCRHY